jgi:hypothetical protein
LRAARPKTWPLAGFPNCSRSSGSTPYDGTGRLHVPTRGYAPPPDRPPYYLPLNGVVLELKYDDRAPQWMYDMVKVFNLQRNSMCKYCASIDGLGLAWGCRAIPERELPLLLKESL